MFGAALVLPDAIDVASIRLGDAWQRYALVDRGSYDYIDRVEDAPLFATLAKVAARVTGRRVTVREARALRFHAGDYALAHHDWIYDDNPVELAIALTTAPAELHYRRRGQVVLRFPSVAGSVAVVERGPSVTSNHTYVSQLDAGACAIRLIAILR